MSLPNSESSNPTEIGDQAWEVVYDRKSIISWLSTVESEPASPGSLYPSPPKSMVSMTSPKRQRAETGSNAEQRQHQDSPSKRRKTTSENLSMTELDERTVFAPPPSKPPSSRSTSPSRGLTNYLRKDNPPFDFREPTIEEGYHGYPKHVNALLKYMSQTREDVIPQGLKDRIVATDLSSRVIPNQWYSSEDMTPAALDRIWEVVEAIYDLAHTADQYLQDENAWNRIVYLVVSWNSFSGRDLIDVVNIQTQLIQPSLLPKMGSGITFSKKADFALCFSIRHAEVKPYYRKLCYLDRCYLLSQMSDESTSRMSLFCGLEVKSQKDANYDEALAQLGIWIGAGLRKSEQLGLHAEESSMEPEDLNIQEENQRDEESMHAPVEQIAKKEPLEVLPLVGFTVVGHEWRMYLGYKKPGADAMLHIVGPWEVFGGTTKTMLGIFKLLRLIERLKSWAREIYWPWLKMEILDPLMPKEN